MGFQYLHRETLHSKYEAVKLRMAKVVQQSEVIRQQRHLVLAIFGKDLLTNSSAPKTFTEGLTLAASVGYDATDLESTN